MKSLSSYSFLVVDDVWTTRISLQMILKNLGNPTSYDATNGREAIDLLQGQARDVSFIISDFNMPVMHGLEMVKRIRTGHGQVRREIPIMMLTGHGDRNLLSVALELDVNAFLLKPAKENSVYDRFLKLIEVQESGENWLKPAANYQSIDTESPIQAILDDPPLEEYAFDYTGGGDSASDHRPKGRTQPVARPPAVDPANPSGIGAGQSTDDARALGIAKAIANQQKKHDAKLVSRGTTPTPDSQKRRGDTPATRDKPNERKKKTVPPAMRYPLNQLPRGAILARDLIGSNGKILLRADTRLTPSMIDRLKDMKTLGEPIDLIWTRIMR